MIVTLGAREALVKTASMTQHVPAFNAGRVMETTRAGDAFNAGLAIALSEGLDVVGGSLRFDLRGGWNFGDAARHCSVHAEAARGDGTDGPWKHPRGGSHGSEDRIPVGVRETCHRWSAASSSSACGATCAGPTSSPRISWKPCGAMWPPSFASFAVAALGRPGAAPSASLFSKRPMAWPTPLRRAFSNLEWLPCWKEVGVGGDALGARQRS